jgi:hypothetical protein
LGTITEPEVEVEVLEAGISELLKKISEVDILTSERALNLKLISDFSASTRQATSVNSDRIINPEVCPGIPTLISLVNIEGHCEVASGTGECDR